MSGSIVVCNHGETLTCGFGGSLLNCLLAFLSDCPTVLIPTRCSGFKKFGPSIPPGFDGVSQLFGDKLGNNSSGFKTSLGRHSFLFSEASE